LKKVIKLLKTAAQFLAQSGTPPVRMLRHQISNQSDLDSRDVPVLNEYALCHSQHRVKLRCSSPAQQIFRNFSVVSSCIYGVKKYSLMADQWKEWQEAGQVRKVDQIRNFKINYTRQSLIF